MKNSAKNTVMQKSQKISAYFTVESAMVMVLVTAVIVVLVYIMLFQYNRCLLEQDMGSLVLKGCTVQVQDKKELLQRLQEFDSNIDRDKYIAWKQDEVTLKLEYDKVEVAQSGSLLFPFRGNAYFGMQSEWETSIVYENKRISPVTFIRMSKKIMGGK